MSYYRAKERDDDMNAAYRLYVAKSLEILVKSVSGCHLTDFAELIQIKPKDTRTADMVIDDVVTRAGLTFGGDEP